MQDLVGGEGRDKGKKKVARPREEKGERRGREKERKIGKKI